MSKYTTGEMAKLCGVTVRTVQYYDTRGILVPSELSEGGRRLYTEDDLRMMKMICFLRDVGLSIDSINKLLTEEDPGNVISILLDQQEQVLKDEMAASKSKMQKLEELKKELKAKDIFSVESIGDVAYTMENRDKLKGLYRRLLITAIPVGILQWGSIIYGFITWTWWPFLVYLVIGIPYAIWASKYYFKRVVYICPQCHTVFKPRFKEAFFARHTPRTRKLTCTSCGHKGFCVEVYDDSQNKTK
ncbi:MAG: MerR family transcriptional regulator [Firmicutes bacterium]|nr:MerR family transcriptional regulator [Bacillota bacterium]